LPARSDLVGLSPAEPVVVALVLLRNVSPPFLDFIESSGVTTQWSSLVEMLRGTDSWAPFVAPTATAGASLVTGSAAILGTCLVAAAGLAGRDWAGRDRDHGEGDGQGARA